MGDPRLRVVMLCGHGASARIMFHGIDSHVDVQCVIQDCGASGKNLIKRRMKKLGVLKTSGQLLFLVFNRFLALSSRGRVKALMAQYGLDDSGFPEGRVRQVQNLNSQEAIDLLRELKPEAVVVNGTRILSKALIAAIPAPFINTHVGITPKYRGVHGGYWALASGDPEHCGVTVHLVDEGIDTGGVLYQDTIQPGPGDTFQTYPIHQIAKAIPLMKAALTDVREGRLQTRPGPGPSRLWHHPTLFEYLKHWMLRGVR